jgi:metal-sulfur cluster biosynthetic enzyme
MLTPDAVKEALRPVVDPEIGFSIVDLGLVYGVNVSDDGLVSVDLTLTSRMCPLGPQLMQAVEAVVSSLEGVKGAQVRLVWNPPWDPKRHASEDVKAMLGIWDLDEEDDS